MFERSKNEILFDTLLKQYQDKLTDAQYKQITETGQMDEDFCSLVTSIEMTNQNLMGIDLDRFPNLHTIKAIALLGDEDGFVPIIVEGRRNVEMLINYNKAAKIDGGGIRDAENVAAHWAEKFRERYGLNEDEEVMALDFKEVVETCSENEEESIIMSINDYSELEKHCKEDEFDAVQKSKGIGFIIEGTDTRLNLQEVTSFFNLVNTFKETYQFNNMTDEQKIQCAYQFANDVNFLSALKCENNPEAPNYDATVSNVFSFILQSEGINAKVIPTSTTRTYTDDSTEVRPYAFVDINGRCFDCGGSMGFFNLTYEEVADKFLKAPEATNNMTQGLGIEEAHQNALEEGQELVKQFVPRKY